MEVVKKYEVMGDALFHVNWEQFVNILPRSKAYQIVEEYTTSLGYGELPEVKDSQEDDAHYRRDAIEVKELDKPSEVYKKQLMDQLKNNGIETKEYSDLQLAVEEGYVECLENFGIPQVVVDLGHGDYMIAPVTSEELTIRLLNPVQGCLIVYKPRMFALVRIKSNE